DMRVAIVQMTATCDLDQNLKVMRSYVQEAHRKKADVVVFPEMAYFIGHSAECTKILPQYETLMKTFSSWAKEFAVELVPGTLREPVGKLPCRQYNSLPYFDATGTLLVTYRKIFLFRAELPDRVYD